MLVCPTCRCPARPRTPRPAPVTAAPASGGVPQRPQRHPARRFPLAAPTAAAAVAAAAAAIAARATDATADVETTVAVGPICLEPPAHVSKTQF